MLPDYDCLVVGGGLVGAAQALALCDSGLRVAVVEARAESTSGSNHDVRGLALAPASRTILEALGVWHELAANIAPVKHVHVSEQGRFGITRMHASDIGIEALAYVCPADQLVLTLEAALSARCEVHWQTQIGTIEQRPDRIVATTHSAAGERLLSARLLIGADGANSHIREAMSIGVRSRDYGQYAIVARVDIEAVPQRTAFERFTSNGPLAILPGADGRYVVVRCCKQEQLDALLNCSDEEYLSALAESFGFRFGRFSNLGRRHHHPLILQSARQVVAERVALVGAAANSIHPNGAQGLNLGLRDIASLARCVTAAANIGDEICLGEFARERSADHRAVIRFTDTLAQVFSSRLPIVPSLRQFAMLCFDRNPLAKRAMIRRGCGLIDESHRIASA